MTLAILEEHRAVARETHLDRPRLRRALDHDRFAEEVHLLPVIADLVLVGVFRIRLLDEKVGLIGADDGEAPGDTVVVAQRDAGQRWLAAADDVPSWSVQM